MLSLLCTSDKRGHFGKRLECLLRAISGHQVEQILAVYGSRLSQDYFNIFCETSGRYFRLST